MYNCNYHQCQLVVVLSQFNRKKLSSMFDDIVIIASSIACGGLCIGLITIAVMSLWRHNVSASLLFTSFTFIDLGLMSTIMYAGEWSWQQFGGAIAWGGLPEGFLVFPFVIAAALSAAAAVSYACHVLRPTFRDALELRKGRKEVAALHSDNRLQSTQPAEGSHQPAVPQRN